MLIDLNNITSLSTRARTSKSDFVPNPGSVSGVAHAVLNLHRSMDLFLPWLSRAALQAGQ
jgi:hypothetical protein